MFNCIIMAGSLVLNRLSFEINAVKCAVHALHEDFWCVYVCKEMGHGLVHRQEIVEHSIAVSLMAYSMFTENNIAGLFIPLLFA